MPPDTTTITAPGTVALSTILDALEDVLTEPQRATLMAQLIGLRPSGVAPGDLITAELFNAVISDVNDLKIRVAALEGAAGGPVIERLDPAITVEVLKTLSIFGRNFDPERRNNIVHIGDDISIAQFRQDSDATVLRLALPDLFTNLPATLPVRVETGGKMSNAVSIRIVPPQYTQSGNFVFGPAAAPTTPLAIGGNVTINWPVQAVTLFDDTINLAVEFAQINGADETAWRAQLAFATANPLPIAMGETKSVQVGLKVPAGAVSARVALRATSEDGHVSNVSDFVQLTIGAPIEQSSPDLDLSIRIPTLGNGGAETGQVLVDGVAVEGVLLAKGAAGKIEINARDKRTAGPALNLAWDAALVAPVAGVAVAAPSPASATGMPLGDTRKTVLTVTVDPGVASGTIAQLRVNCTATGTGVTQFKAFRTIPLQIKN